MVQLDFEIRGDGVQEVVLRVAHVFNVITVEFSRHESVRLLGGTRQIEAGVCFEYRYDVRWIGRVSEVGNRIESILDEVLHYFLLEGEQIPVSGKLGVHSHHTVRLALGSTSDRRAAILIRGDRGWCWIDQSRPVSHRLPSCPGGEGVGSYLFDSTMLG